MRQRELVHTMGVRELLEWMAYDLSCDDEFREKAFKEIAIEEQMAQTAEQEAERVRQFFMGFVRK